LHGSCTIAAEPEQFDSNECGLFDEALKQALSVGLQQSLFFGILSDHRIQDTLRLMNHPPNQRLTPEVAREICQRTGSLQLRGRAGSVPGRDREKRRHFENPRSSESGLAFDCWSALPLLKMSLFMPPYLVVGLPQQVGDLDEDSPSFKS
jgi:hypothetical protein